MNTVVFWALIWAFDGTAGIPGKSAVLYQTEAECLTAKVSMEKAYKGPAGESKVSAGSYKATSELPPQPKAPLP